MISLCWTTREVDGIGPVRAGRIVAAWAEQKVVREIMDAAPMVATACRFDLNASAASGVRTDKNPPTGRTP